MFFFEEQTLKVFEIFFLIGVIKGISNFLEHWILPSGHLTQLWKMAIYSDIPIRHGDFP